MSTTYPAPVPGPSGSESRSVRARLGAVGVGIGLILLALVVSVVAIVPVVFLVPDIGGTAFLVGGVVAGQLVFLAVGAAYVRFRLAPGSVVVRRPTRRETGWVLGGTLGALVLLLALATVGATLGLTPESSVFEPYLAADPTIALVLGVLSVVLIAPAEELLFRGAIQTRLGRAFGPAATVAGSALLFGSVHLLNFGGGLTGMLFGAGIIVVGGAVLAAAYQRTGNLAVPIAIHGCYNATLFGLSYLTFA